MKSLYCVVFCMKAGAEATTKGASAVGFTPAVLKLFLAKVTLQPEWFSSVKVQAGRRTGRVGRSWALLVSCSIGSSRPWVGNETKSISAT